jgi:hypothetical protein
LGRERLRRLEVGVLELIERLPWPLAGWTSMRDMPEPPAETFRD